MSNLFATVETPVAKYEQPTGLYDVISPLVRKVRVF